mgnify:CR=1 FL=1
MTTKNDVTSADGDSADIDATIFTIGARSEMAFQISKSCQAVPYVGLNYLRVATDATTPPRASPWMTWTRTS